MPLSFQASAYADSKLLGPKVNTVHEPMAASCSPRPLTWQEGFPVEGVSVVGKCWKLTLAGYRLNASLKLIAANCRVIIGYPVLELVKAGGYKRTVLGFWLVNDSSYTIAEASFQDKFVLTFTGSGAIESPNENGSSTVGCLRTPFGEDCGQLQGGPLEIAAPGVNTFGTMQPHSSTWFYWPLSALNNRGFYPTNSSPTQFRLAIFYTGPIIVNGFPRPQRLPPGWS